MVSKRIGVIKRHLLECWWKKKEGSDGCALFTPLANRRIQAGPLFARRIRCQSFRSCAVFYFSSSISLNSSHSFSLYDRWMRRHRFAVALSLFFFSFISRFIISISLIPTFFSLLFRTSVTLKSDSFISPSHNPEDRATGPT